MTQPAGNAATKALIAALADRLQARNHMLCTAESCTGGGIAALLTEIPGSSRWFERGFVTYSNASKMEMLGVGESTLTQYGAVSESTVREMAAGALTRSHAHWALSVSGIAGPDGGTPEKPVGTICFAWAGPSGTLQSETLLLKGDRATIRHRASLHALKGLLLFCGTV